MKNVILTGFRFSVIFLLLMIFSPAIYSQSDKDARSFNNDGQKALSEDDPYRAVDSFRTALMLNPAYADARLGMAEALFLLTEYDEAAREIDRARPYAAGRRDLVLLEARILTALGSYGEAAALYEKLLAGRPHDAAANRGLAEIYTIIGQRELADDAYDRSLQYSPGDRRVLLQLVLLHDEAREKTQADTIMFEAIRLFPDNLAVRIQAAEHFALYDEWVMAMDHLERAKSMVSGPDDNRNIHLALLDAELSLRKGDPASALAALSSLPSLDSPEILYLLARSYRDLGNEDQAQSVLSRLLKTRSEDEIARMFREETLMLSSGDFDIQRDESAAWHLEKGKVFEENFYFDRAYYEYRRARLLNKFNPEVWLAYTDILRKLGFQEHYQDSLNAALIDIPDTWPEYSILKRRLELLEHSEMDSLADRWGIVDPWTVETAEWNIGVYVLKNSHSLPIHTGSQNTLGLYFSDLLDIRPDLKVPTDASGRNPVVRVAEDYSQAFRKSRENGLDYFVLLRFAETDRTFSAGGELFLARTGEMIGRYDELRTGQGKVSDALRVLAESMSTSIPRLMRIHSSDGNRVLLNKGRWHGVEQGETWIVLRNGSGRPADVEGGLSFAPSDFLGTVEITELSEPLSEGLYERSGDFDFISPGDELFLLPVPEIDVASFAAPDPAFKARLLAIP